jgi:predicted transcriptional regulator
MLENQHYAAKPAFMSGSEANPDIFLEKLTRRERQVIDILLMENELSASHIQCNMGDDVSYSAVRAVLRVLVEKGLVTFRYLGPRYVYQAAIPRQQTRRAILRKVLETYFDGSREDLVETLISDGEASSKELKKIARVIDRAR